MPASAGIHMSRPSCLVSLRINAPGGTGGRERWEKYSAGTISADAGTISADAGNSAYPSADGAGAGPEIRYLLPWRPEI
ncbi:hypothetical protein H8693_05625 [Christensenellaceae bacterium NSJ-63]|uniref:Uncharacterized protein n=1 Tax=Guopingia tenuis TaxID=2763656 RepID=A0A926DHR3_9FIRM|nr:hypothetical protein [Guopingia tenuis]MBC8538411.1 hypothetical protein [Guopingia tenuis]